MSRFYAAFRVDAARRDAASDMRSQRLGGILAAVPKQIADGRRGTARNVGSDAVDARAVRERCYRHGTTLAALRYCVHDPSGVQRLSVLISTMPASDPAPVDILVPTYRRAAALAVTLASLCAQTLPRFRVIVSDQTEDADTTTCAEVRALLRILESQGRSVELHKHLPRRGMAEHRQFLLERATARYVLFLDDDVYVEPDLVARLLDALRESRCGFVGSAVIGLSYVDDVRPGQQVIEFWHGPVGPEEVRPGSVQWGRHVLHNAANLYHVQRDRELTPRNQRLYRVAWVGGCVMYDAAKLRAVGGFRFWKQLPCEHCGEEVLAQLRLMARFGGCGLIPSGAYHLELPTTVPVRDVDAPKVLGLQPGPDELADEAA
jgi:hypothetical protein